uniref:EVE domain-containing protein n=1 Tax=Araucaria cunninghamii TaxID=56994 RepID=A0A0D6QR12_ARACU
MVQYWLLKTEPEEWSWQHQAENNGISQWDGVRNAQAQNNMKAMKVGDLCFFYHSGKSKQIVGIVKIVKEFYADPSDPSGKYGMVDVEAVSQMEKPVTLAQIKQQEECKDFVLIKQPRLSVVPVPSNVWTCLCQLGGYSGSLG